MQRSLKINIKGKEGKLSVGIRINTLIVRIRDRFFCEKMGESGTGERFGHRIQEIIWINVKLI